MALCGAAPFCVVVLLSASEALGPLRIGGLRPLHLSGSASCNFRALLPLMLQTPSASMVTVLLFMATASSPSATTLPAPAAAVTAGLAMAMPPGRMARLLPATTSLIPVGESNVALPALSMQTVAPPA